MKHPLWKKKRHLGKPQIILVLENEKQGFKYVTQGMPYRLEKSCQENLGAEPENQESFTGRPSFKTLPSSLFLGMGNCPSQGHQLITQVSHLCPVAHSTQGRLVKCGFIWASGALELLFGKRQGSGSPQFWPGFPFMSTRQVLRGACPLDSRTRVARGHPESQACPEQLELARMRQTPGVGRRGHALPVADRQGCPSLQG